MEFSPHLRGAVISAPQSSHLAHLRRDFPEVIWVAYDAHDKGVDLIVMVIDADRGISSEDIAQFHAMREFQLPTLILVASLLSDGASDRWDFDDVCMLANRTLEQVLAPYLVLHDEAGQPSGLYDLESDSIIDYSKSPKEQRPADLELKTLTADFSQEWREQNFEFSDFTTGLQVIALPYIPERDVGIAEARAFISKLERVQP